ncbi:hypothetical protein ACLB2K_048179 [Fragaria x ananassa]
MEEAKAAAYYEDLTRRGEGAARFKQGLGFSSSKSDSENAPARGSALAYSSSSSFMSKFVKASSPSKTSGLEKEAQIQSIQNKLKRKKPEELAGEEEKRRPRVSDRDSRKRSRSRERHSRHRSRSRERHSDRDRERRRRRRSRSGSASDGGRRRRSRSPRNRRNERRGSRSRSSSPPRERGLEKSRGKSEKERSGGRDCHKLIQGYDKMSAAERVKAKMKLQLAETAEKDTTKGMDGWERFDFDKDAPLDDDEIEVAEDDAGLVNYIGKSFRFSAFETKRDERIKAAHDEAMFGASDNRQSIMINSEVEAEKDNKECKESEPPSLLSEKVLAKNQGSWRDRIRHNN